MGCDGGTIPKRSEMVRGKKKKERKDKNMNRLAKWTTCAISNKKLKSPIVGCRKGRLYNKESVLEHILTKSKRKEFNHIRKLKDICDLKLKENPNYREGNCTSVELKSAAPFLCPLTNLEMNGKYEFIFIWECGCVASKRAIKNISSNCCVVCNTPFERNDVIVINPESEEDMDQPDDDHEKTKVKKSKTLKTKNTISQIKEPNNSVSSIKSIPKMSVSDPKSDSIYKSLFSSTASKPVPNKDENKGSFWRTSFSYSF